MGLRQDLTKLVKPTLSAEVRRALKALDAQGTKPGAVGVAVPTYPEAGGIASPLTEPDHAARTYHPGEATLTSSDGLFTIRVKYLHKIHMTDANAAKVVLVFAAP